MAIKERKQITGTTAQIKAYEGHEGQIVWDKEKKTFVGMSGTAGKNYPLASQAYVDTRFLPLTGGELTGGVAVRGDDGRGAIYQKDSGASIFLFAPHNSTYKGGFIIRAKGTGGSDLDLKGSYDGTLSWKGQEVECIVARNNGTYVRYSSGLQVVYINTRASPTGYTTTFSTPFSASPTGVATHLGSLNYVVITAMCSPTTLTLRTNYSAEVDAYAIIIGRWK